MKEKNSIPVDVCGLLFKQIKKPDNLVHCKAINVYNNKYRINLYTKRYNEIYDVEQTRITQSYFCRVTGNNLEIQYPKI